MRFFLFTLFLFSCVATCAAQKQVKYVELNEHFNLVFKNNGDSITVFNMTDDYKTFVYEELVFQISYVPGDNIGEEYFHTIYYGPATADLFITDRQEIKNRVQAVRILDTDTNHSNVISMEYNPYMSTWMIIANRSILHFTKVEEAVLYFNEY